LAREAKAMLNSLPTNNAKAALEGLCDAIVDRTV
jgi:geranylgeranyl pyrophosphate synthase